MLGVRDKEDLEQWFQWLCDPRLEPKRQHDPVAPTLRTVVNLLKRAVAKEPGPRPQLKQLLLQAQEALRVSDFHTYYSPTPTSIAGGTEHPTQFSVSSMSGGAGNYAEGQRLFVAVCIASLLWPKENPYHRVAKQNPSKKVYDDRVAQGQQPDKAVRMRVKRFTREAILMRWTAIGFSWVSFKSWKSWDRVHRENLRVIERFRAHPEGPRVMKPSRLTSATKREQRFLTKLLAVQLPGWGPPPPVR